MSADNQQLSKKQRKIQQKEQESKQRRMNQVKIIAVVAIAFGLLALWYSKSRVPVNQSEVNKTPGEIVASDHVRGNPDASVLLIEYADFQCPACGAYSPLIQELVDSYGEEIAVVFRHFPLKQIHFQAEIAAQAAEAAALQGKFWEMKHMLFNRQMEWSEKRNAKDLFIGYAGELGLNTDQFKSDIDSQPVKSKVKADYLNALSLNLTGTPTFFVQGNKIENPANLESFKTILRQAGAAIPEATGAAQLNSDSTATNSASPNPEP